MKLLDRSIDKHGEGSVTLIAEEAEDLWHTYNILGKGDYIKASTVRRVTSETETGSTDKTSVHTIVSLKVEEIEFDVQAGKLRVAGRNVEENKYIRLGAFHTVDIELNRKFTIGKHEWDIIHLERLDDACDVSKRAEIAAVVMEEGLANVCLVTDTMTIVRQRVEVNIPRKRKNLAQNHDNYLNKFFDQVYQAVDKNVDFSIVKVLLIASPGFVKDSFYTYLIEQAQRLENKTLLDNREKIITIHCSSGQKHALAEVLRDPAILRKLTNTKYIDEVKALDQFYQVLNTDMDKACYGYSHVRAAAERGAIGTLLVTNELFRSADIPTRRKYIKLTEEVKSNGGKVLIFSSLHASGEQLTGMTGIAAILNFPIIDLDEEAERIEKEEQVSQSPYLTA